MRIPNIDHGHQQPEIDPAAYTEAMCYGPLHPNGKRLPVDAFLPDPRRVNGVSEFCEACVMERGRSMSEEIQQPTGETAMDTIKCNGCGTVKPVSDYYKGHKTCKRCTLDKQKAAKLKRQGKPVPTVKKVMAKAAEPKPARVAKEDKVDGVDKVDGAKAASVLDVLVSVGLVTRLQVKAAQALAETLLS